MDTNSVWEHMECSMKEVILGHEKSSCTYSLVFSSKHLSMLATASSQNTFMVVFHSNVVYVSKPPQLTFPCSWHDSYHLYSFGYVNFFHHPTGMPIVAQPSQSNSCVTNPMKLSLTRTTFYFFLLLKSLLSTQSIPKNVALVCS